MPALRRAVALVKVNATPMPVGEHLQLDVAGRGDVFLDQHAPVAEPRLRLAHRALEPHVEFDMGVDAAHAAPAPARDRLDEHGIADLIGLLAQELRVLVVAVIAGHDRHAGPLHQRLGRAFQAHHPHRLRRRSNEDDASLGAGFGEIGVLRQESIPRMQTFGADLFRQRENGAPIEVTVRALADLVRFIGKAGEKRPAIDRRMEGDRPHSHAPRSANNAAGDFAAVGDKDVGEHGGAPTALVSTEHAFGWRAALAAATSNRWLHATDRQAPASRLWNRRPAGA
jgi:hypothetical protein